MKIQTPSTASRIFLFPIIVVLAMASYLPSLSSYGVTWDEYFHRGTGLMYLKFLRTGDLSEIMNWSMASWLPPTASTLGYLFIDNNYLSRIFPEDQDRFHIASIAFGSITVGLVFLISLILTENLPVSLLASFLLAAHPQFVLHSHTNVRDIGLTMFFTLTIYLLLLASMRNFPLWLVQLAGISTALATTSKQNGAFLIFIAIIFFLIHKPKTSSPVGHFKNLFIIVSLYLGSFIFTFYLTWPYLWQDTFNHLSSVWQYLRSESVLGGTLTFYDQIYRSMQDIPFYYPWVMLAILTPPPFLILIVTGLITALVKTFSGHRNYALILLWLVVPLSRFLYPASSISHDQIRHFLEVFPTLPIFASIAIFYLWKHSQKPLAVIFAFIALFYTAFISHQFAPNGNAYFNFLAGPPDYVTHAFDVEYWGNVYRQAARELNLTYPPTTIYYARGMGESILAEDGLQGKFASKFEDPYDYVLFINKQNWIRNDPYLLWLIHTQKPILTIQKGGVTLLYMFLPHKEEFISSQS